VTDRSSRVVVEVDSGSDTEARAEAAASLQEELLNYQAIEDVTSLEASNVPADAKAIPLVIGAILVKVAEAAIPALVAGIHNWLNRQGEGSVKVTIGGDSFELTHATVEERATLLVAFLQAHSQP